MSKFAVYDYVNKCKGCIPSTKRLPGINKVMPSEEDLVSGAANSAGNICNDSSNLHKNSGQFSE